MAEDEQIYGAHGIGKWHPETKRYIPMGGGSRSRLELEIKGLRPYRGFSGVDSLENVKIDSIAILYAKLDQGLHKIAQSNAYLSAPEASPKAEQIASLAAESQLEQKAQTALELQVEQEAPAVVELPVEQDTLVEAEELQVEQEEPKVEPEVAAQEELQVEQEAVAREEPVTSMQPHVAEEAAGHSSWGIPDDFEL